MIITGADTILLYGEKISPIPAAEMRHRTSCVRRRLKDGSAVLRLTYDKQNNIKDITAYTLTPDGEIYVGDVVPTMEPEGYCVAQTWHESVYLSDELEDALDHWTSDRGYVEWYETASREFWDNLDGPALTDFVNEYLKLNPDFSVESDEDCLEEDEY